MGKSTAVLVFESDGLISCWDAPLHPSSLFSSTAFTEATHSACVIAQAACMASLAGNTLNPWRAFPPSFTEKPGEVVPRAKSCRKLAWAEHHGILWHHQNHTGKEELPHEGVEHVHVGTSPLKIIWLSESWRVILIPTKHLDTQPSTRKR